MLVLSRLVGESFVINDNIIITVLGKKGNQYRIGFEAPKEVSILRKEAHEKIKNLSKGNIK